MAKINKGKIDLINVMLKGFRQELDIWTTATESTEFVDWLNNNPALNSYKVEDKEKFTNSMITRKRKLFALIETR